MSRLAPQQPLRPTLYFRQAVASKLHFRQIDASNFTVREFGGINSGRFLQSSLQCFASCRGKLMGEVTRVAVTLPISLPQRQAYGSNSLPANLWFQFPFANLEARRWTKELAFEMTKVPPRAG